MTASTVTITNDGFKAITAFYSFFLLTSTGVILLGGGRVNGASTTTGKISQKTTSMKEEKSVTPPYIDGGNYSITPIPVTRGYTNTTVSLRLAFFSSLPSFSARGRDVKEVLYGSDFKKEITLKDALVNSTVESLFTIDFYRVKRNRENPKQLSDEYEEALKNGVSDEAVKGSVILHPLTALSAYVSGNNVTILDYDEHRYNVQINNDSNIVFTISSVSAINEGVYVWKLTNLSSDRTGVKTSSSVIRNGSFLITAYKPPDNVKITIMSHMLGESYNATCFVTKFYPPGSVFIYWKDAMTIIDKSRYSTITADGYDGTIGLISSLTLPEHESSTENAVLKCFAVMKTERSKNVFRFSESLSPREYVRPRVTAYVNGEGKVVCQADCVPRSAMSVRWFVDGKESGGNGMTTETVTNGLCERYPGLVNILHQRDLSEKNGPVTYKCVLMGYPADLPEFGSSVTFDASPNKMGMPVILTVMFVILMATCLGSLILITALCLYYNDNTGL